MPRCDYDVVFYRVFCFTLLGAAFAFTVILTNVFIDIDGLLYKKGKVKSDNLEHIKQTYEIIPKDDPIIDNYEDYGDYSDNDRRKRSAESEDLIQEIKDAKLKSVLKNRLALFLDQFDEANNKTDMPEEKTEDKTAKAESIEVKVSKDVIKDIKRLKNEKNKSKEEVLHLALHNIILQGILGGMDLKELYKKAYDLERDFKNNKVHKFLGENKFLDEILNCKELQHEVVENEKMKNHKKLESRTKRKETKNRNVIIQTTINITSFNDKTNQDENSKETINGIIKLIYNGKEYKFVQYNDKLKPKVPKQIFNNILQNYLKEYDVKGTHSEVKRFKRQTESEVKPTRNKDEDELFVEIETHVDSKGTKGERKKKLIRDLVDKIQKAIHSGGKDTKKHKLHIKKRIQNPLDHHDFIDKVLKPLDKFMHRNLDPISKSVPVHESMPHVSDNKGEKWAKKYYGPHFLSVSKGINSAEMSEVETAYDKVEIPHRLQQPLDEIVDNNNTRFVLKDIDGTGFAIGFNQYVDEPPDTETMKLFSGLKNVIETYHQHYDIPDTHVIVRRSTNNKDYHSNEYKIIFNNNFLPFTNYQDVYNHETSRKQSKKDKNAPFIIDNNILNKNLRPAEILSLANLFERKKRSIPIKRLPSLNKKRILYINTKAMAAKNVLLKQRRSKRQVNKIRIIARDVAPKSDEIFVVSDEKLFANRAVVNDVITPESEDQKFMNHFDVISPEKADDNHYDIITPYMYEAPKENLYYKDIFAKTRHNPLMSKYPHIFMEEMSRNDDDYEPFYKTEVISATKSTTTVPTVETNYVDHNVIPKTWSNYPNDNSKLKVTVKITPKNGTLNSGFKEVHTSINKSYHKNGLTYTSLVNVSELSKIEKANVSREFNYHNLDQLKAEHDRIRYFIEQHKNRLEEQLKLLKSEKENLDKIESGNFDIFNTPSTPITTTVQATLKTTKEPPQTTTTLKPIKEDFKTTDKPQKDNTTTEILAQINRNNELLQKFLQKIAAQIVQTTPTPAIETSAVTLRKNYDPYEQINSLFFNKLSKNMEPRGIPFIYMFQRPTTVDTQPKSVIYQGHIHTDDTNSNSYTKYETIDYKNSIKPKVENTSIRRKAELKAQEVNDKGNIIGYEPKFVLKNNTRLLLDNLADYKLIPVANKVMNGTKV